MSIKIMHLVWESAPYAEGSLLVLLALADWADDNGIAWPSMENLAQKARLKTRQTQYIIRKIKSDGFLTIDEGGGRGNQHRYQINLDKLKGAEIAPFRERKGAVQCAKRVQSSAQRVQSTTQKVHSTAPDPLEEPLVDPSEEPPYEGEAFLEAFASFERSRLRMRKPLTPDARRLLYRKLAGWDEPTATQALEDAVINRWQGVFEPRGNGKGNGNGKSGQSGSYQTAAERRSASFRGMLSVVEELRSEGSGAANKDVRRKSGPT